MMKPTPLRSALLLLPCVAVGALAWALFWPSGTCSDPACARNRFSLFAELDSFRGIEPIPLEVTNSNKRISARSILRSGGIDLTIEHDEDVLPHVAESGPLDRADLYQYSLAWRNRAAPSRVDAQIYAMLTPALVSDTGERLFGIMFDSAGREGVAVAPRETARTFRDRDPDAIPLLQLRTFMHEMLHALNRRHLDAVQMNDGRVTLEAPTRCLIDSDGSQWYLKESPLMALSPATIEFFQSAAPRDVLPGGNNAPFGALRSSATECDDVRANSTNVAESRWDLAKKRLLSLFFIQAAHAQEAAEAVDAEGFDEQEAEEEESPRIALRVRAQEAAYPLGYPIAIRLMAQNLSAQPLPLKGRLSPGYGLVQIQYRLLEAQDWEAFRPLAWFEPADDDEALLEPSGQTEQTVAIYFGDGGWTFPEPGAYQLRATLHTDKDTPEIISNTVSIRIATAQTEDERAVLEPLVDEQGALNQQVGRLLIFGGRIGDAALRAPIEAAVENYSDTALGSALQLTLASQRLSPAIDPLTGQRASPKIADAEELLRDTCTDSGIAALKHELLMRFAEDLPQQMTARLHTSAEAWDGTTARNGALLSTYSDPELKQLPTSVHFCINETTLTGEPQLEARRVARELNRTTPQRIVVVGHADFEGTCTFNDTLALQRAQSVGNILVRAGVPRSRIHTVSLGERRPLDFSSTNAARQLNRRVELLIDSEQDSEEEEQLPDAGSETAATSTQEDEVRHVLPRCSGG